MIIQTYDFYQLERGLAKFNKIIEEKGSISVYDIDLISFWNGPFIIGEIENQDIMESLRWHKDTKILSNYGWNEKIYFSEIRKELLSEELAERLNKHHCFTSTLPEPKEL